MRSCQSTGDRPGLHRPSSSHPSTTAVVGVRDVEEPNSDFDSQWQVGINGVIIDAGGMAANVKDRIGVKT